MIEDKDCNFKKLSPNGKCPICERALIKEKISRFGISRYCHYCLNDCFIYHDHTNEAIIQIFDDYYVVQTDRMLSSIYAYDKISSVEDKIKYWLEDYKYVAELLERK